MKRKLRYAILLILTCGLIMLTAISTGSSSVSATDIPSARSLIRTGVQQFRSGSVEAALSSWQAAEQDYERQGDTDGVLLSKVNQIQALRSLGYYSQSQQIVVDIQQTLSALPDSLLKAQSLQTVGISFISLGQLEAARAAFSKSLVIAQQFNDTNTIASAYFQLGNTAQAADNFGTELEIETAQHFYQQALASADPDSRIWLEIALNQSRLLVQQPEEAALSLASPLIEEVRSRLADLSPSRWTIYAQINLAETLLSFPGEEPSGIEVLTNALSQSRSLKDRRAESYVLGQLGKFYEHAKQWSDALLLTEQALQQAQQLQANEMIASWQWQRGRILNAQGEKEKAIAAYSQAVILLESLDQDLVAPGSEAQFSFQQRVEPVYRELVALLLDGVDQLPANKQQQRLIKSRDVIESLQLAELENFFREACLTYEPRPIDEIDSHAAVIYPIVLGDRLEVILTLPGQPLQHYGNFLPDQLATFQALRQALNPAFPATEILAPAQQIYDWLIRPAETILTEQSIERLVFVPDDYLRSVPMSVLHDGSQFLIEKYGVALTPGLQLFEPSKLNSQQLKVLAGGITAAQQGFGALPAVDAEVAEIRAQFPSQVLLNADFTNPNIAKEIEDVPFSVVHLATHGQFSSKAEDTFILTWNNQLQIRELERLLQQRELQTPVELLVLSACQTAKGDNRAALGMAGIAVRSGARSTIASLWSVQDRSTAELMSRLYQELNQTQTSRTEALRQAQLSLLNTPDYAHPYYWAPFVLIGSWL
ncbi:tetratricopeptide repeat domain protein [Synechococcus sp. PCC 7335]|uniref:CHAT domain-containing protein n=1 Tax=Synechococcus sp. (strain ATCC 29403 / PCC 7335) TaxID=91464 RepID=UPI00017ECF16|nr:CHAT domain-containing protein [Synechococcus sp. PCC 7335]EDX83577.1 tetratricopeptide repeat domain protein [Synechococcus sp. PCC 7335]